MMYYFDIELVHAFIFIIPCLLITLFKIWTRLVAKSQAEIISRKLNEELDFMVHIKYGSHKLTLKLDKDSTIDQLKQKISQALNIAERDLNILINGKPIPVQGHITFSQARIPNNCKILVTNKSSEQFSTTSSDYGAHTSAHRVPATVSDNHDTKVDAIDTQLDNIKAKSMQISQTVRSLEDKTSQLKRNIRHSQEAVQEIKGYKKTAGVQGELLMRCLENLDQQQIDPGMAEQKLRRKELATLLNNILDRNDRVMADFSQHIKSLES